MEFVGNKTALFLANVLASDIRQGYNHNIIIQGKSGYGKTTLAKYIADTADVNYTKLLGNDEVYSRSVILIIDEVHLAKTPETYYHIMDTHSQTIILITTEVGDLPIPLVNRCIPITLVEYTEEELLQICKLHGKKYSEDVLIEVVKRCRAVPRVIVTIIERLDAYKRMNKVLTNENIRVILDTFGIYENGFTDLDFGYINFLKNNGGKASLNTLAKVLELPKSTLENYIEPFLLRQKLIKISSRGRELDGN